jgi:hypothetical protein
VSSSWYPWGTEIGLAKKGKWFALCTFYYFYKNLKENFYTKTFHFSRKSWTYYGIHIPACVEVHSSWMKPYSLVFQKMHTLTLPFLTLPYRKDTTDDSEFI